MFKRYEYIIALRYLRAKKRPKFLSLISGFSLVGVAIGVAALIVVMSVMNGFRKEITEKIIGLNGEIIITNYSNPITDYQKLLLSLKSHSDVISAHPSIEKEVLISFNSKTSGALVKALSKEDFSNKKIISQRMIQGTGKNFANEEGVILGYELAHRLSTYPGAYITLISPEGAANTLIGFIPRMKTYKVLGLFDSGMYQYDSSTVIMPLKQAQTFFKLQDKISLIEVYIKDPLNSFKIMKEIDYLLKHQYKVIDWQLANESFFKVLKIERIAMFFILTLIIIVAAFNIISSLIMLVKDKTNDIAILCTLGITKASVMRIFFLTGSLIGIMGTAIGTILGISFAANINKIKNFLEKITSTRIFNPVVYYLSNLPSDLQLNNVLIIVCLSLSLSFIATLYPAYSAAKSNPLESLRYE